MDEHYCLPLTSVKTFILSVHSENVKPNLKLGSSWSLVKYDPKLSYPSSLSKELGHFRRIFLESPHSHREGKAVWWKMSWLDFTLQASLPASRLLSHTRAIHGRQHPLFSSSNTKYQTPDSSPQGFCTCSSHGLERFSYLFSFSLFLLITQGPAQMLLPGRFPQLPRQVSGPQREHSIFFLAHITNPSMHLCDHMLGIRLTHLSESGPAVLQSAFLPALSSESLGSVTGACSTQASEGMTGVVQEFEAHPRTGGQPDTQRRARSEAIWCGENSKRA